MFSYSADLGRNPTMKRYSGWVGVMVMILGVVVGCARDRWGGCPGGACTVPSSGGYGASTRAYNDTYVPPSGNGSSSFGADIGGGAGS